MRNDITRRRWTLIRLGKLHERKNQPMKALNYWQRAAKLAPDSMTVHAALTRLLRRLGKRTEAAREAALVHQLERKQHSDELANPRLPTTEAREHQYCSRG